MTDDLDKLEAIAKEAQEKDPGPWIAVSGGKYSDDCLTISRGSPVDPTDVATEIPWVVTAAHIATFSPDVVLRLIARIRQQDAKLAEQEWKLRHLRESGREP
jgi:hypothetical protein